MSPASHYCCLRLRQLHGTWQEQLDTIEEALLGLLQAMGEPVVADELGRAVGELREEIEAVRGEGYDKGYNDGRSRRRAA